MKNINIKDKKIICFVLVITLILLFLSKGPAFGRYNNRGNTGVNVWSGLVASNYRSGNGSRNNPYIISNGEELAYLSVQLENNDYSGTYFKIVNNILLNEGIFKYENNVLMYVLNSITYYVNGNEYYDNPNFIGESTGTLNRLNSLEGFKGTIDGDSHAIYGYFNDEALFTSFEGNIKSLYLENALVTGNSAILANSISSSNLSNIIVDGYVIGSLYVPSADETIDVQALKNYSTLNKNVLGGITSYAADSTITNCVSKVNITGGYLSGGIVGYSNNTSITNGYFNGDLASYSGNAIGVVKGNGSITRVYSSGSFNGGLIGYIVDANPTINNSFITTDNNLVVDLLDSNVTSSGNYYVYVNRGDNINSIRTLSENLKSHMFLQNYSEFINNDDLNNNSQNVWVFNDETYPLLYIDDVINNNSELYIGTHMWNSYSKNLRTYNFTNNIVIMISDVDNVHVTTKYYYVSDSITPLSKSELDSVTWIEYSDAVTIENEGTYVIYVKTIDNNNNIDYINSDILVLDNSGSEITITMGNNTYDSLMETEVYVDSPFSITVAATDALSGVKRIEYYLSNTRIDDLDNVNNWATYSNAVNVNNVGEHILYVKVTDGCDLVTYASTPLVIYDGYVISNLKPVGFNSGNSITKNSSIMFDIAYSNNKQVDITHNLVSTAVLPNNTKITLLDKTNNKVYEYIVTSSSTVYPLTGFKEKGKNTDTYYQNNQVTNESYTVIIDFSNCEISTDYSNVDVYLEGINNGTLIRPTITKSSFNVFADSNLAIAHSISTNFSGNINYKSDSSTDIVIHNSVVMSNTYDTSYSDKKTGLAIKVEDLEGNLIDSDYLKNIIFKIGDDKYAPDADSITRINLNTNSSSDITLTIVTYDGALRLENGTYNIKIYGYVANDGIYYGDETLTSPITIPMVVANNDTSKNSNYSFKVLNDFGEVIIDKGSLVDYSFKVLQDGLKNPNIKVSMYKKNQLTAYNQEYTLIDMADYTNDDLDEYIEKIYYVRRSAYSYSRDKKYNVFNYGLDTTELDKTCYKFVFDVYSGNTKIESISKYIIVR